MKNPARLIRWWKLRNSRYDRNDTAAPVNTTPPSITGHPDDNSILIGDVGKWNNHPVEYKTTWLINGEPEGYGETYFIKHLPAGATVQFQVIAVNHIGQTTATATLA